MPKKAYISDYYSSEELKKKYFTSINSVETRRWHLLWKISLGWTIKKSSMAVGISYDYAREILQKYNNQGEEGIKIKRKKRGGKPPLLNDSQREKLSKLLESKPIDGGVWTGPKVARWIEKETGRQKVWNQRGWDYLKKCEYSWQRPRRKHRKGNKLEQEEFKQKLPLKVQKLAQENPEHQIEVWCLGARSLASFADAGSHRFLTSIEWD